MGEVPPPDPSAFGAYTLIQKLAAGGMGEIFLALKRGPAGFEKLVVIKRLLPHLAADTRFVEMLLREARLAARLSHPNICAVHDLGSVDGKFYIAMEYLEGLPLSTILKSAAEEGRVLDPSFVVGLFCQACEGLHHAHQSADDLGQSLELVHRDISPSNLMVTTAGLVKVLDFGIAKAQRLGTGTRTGAPKGKLPYMSPEQLAGEPLDRRSDIFSLGAVLYEALTLERLFQRPTEYLTYRAIRKDPIPPLDSLRPDVTAELAAAIARALARDRQDRFATARDLERALLEAVAPTGAPWQTKQIAEYLHAYHQRDIPARPARLWRGTAAAEEPPAGPRTVTLDPDLPAAPDGRAAPPEAPTVAAAGLRPPRRSRRRLLVVVGLGVLVAGAVALGTRLTAAPRSVLIVEGTVKRDDGTSLAAEPAAVPAPAAAEAARPSAPALAAPEPARPVAEPSGRKPRRGAAPTGKLSAVFERHDREIAACFTRHAGGPRVEGDLAVEFRIDRGGHVERAQLEPPALAATRLGDCILAVARKTEFGPQTDALDFRIPLRVHAEPR